MRNLDQQMGQTEVLSWSICLYYYVYTEYILARGEHYVAFGKFYHKQKFICSKCKYILLPQFLNIRCFGRRFANALLLILVTSSTFTFNYSSLYRVL